MKLFFCLALLLGSASARLGSHRKLIRPQDRSTIIDGSYIIVLEDFVEDVDSKVNSIMKQSGCSVQYTYKEDIKGAALGNLNDIMLWKILDDPDVLFVEADQVVKASAEQRGATWGLDRIDETSLPLDNNYRYDYTGSGVTAFVVDTGLRTSHNDFGGRASCGFDVFRSNCVDDQGHGSHVGTLG